MFYGGFFLCKAFDLSKKSTNLSIACTLQFIFHTLKLWFRFSPSFLKGDVSVGRKELQPQLPHASPRGSQLYCRASELGRKPHFTAFTFLTPKNTAESMYLCSNYFCIPTYSWFQNWWNPVFPLVINTCLLFFSNSICYQSLTLPSPREPGLSLVGWGIRGLSSLPCTSSGGHFTTYRR